MLASALWFMGDWVVDPYNNINMPLMLLIDNTNQLNEGSPAHIN